MNLMTDAVSGAGEIDAVSSGDALEISVIIRIFKTDLNGVMVNIADREFCADPWNIHGFELKVSHGSRGILGQGLIDSNPDLFARFEFAGEEMGFENFLGDCFAHEPINPLAEE
jgi:hypothetical protein